MKVTLKPILPKNLDAYLDVNAAERNLKDALDHTINIVHDDFQSTMGTWKEKAKFEKKPARQIGSRLEAKTFTDNEIYGYLTRGTKKNYPIPKTGFARLSFRAGYKAKTRVGVIGSRAGGAFGARRFAKRVIHPGIEARNFDKVIARRRQRNMTNLCRNAILKSFRPGVSG